jgi:DNA-binding PadR family transcriptional regulator
VSVQNVVLGELIGRRGYGYGYELLDQLREFLEVMGYSSTVIYPALEGLEKQGFVTVVDRDQGSAGGHQAKSRVYYEVTEAGRDHFREWKASAPKKTPLREELHMLLMAADVGDVPDLVKSVGDVEEQCREQLRQLMHRPLGSRTTHDEKLGATFIHDALLAHLQTTMEWAQRTRASLQSLVDHPSGVPGRRRP